MLCLLVSLACLCAGGALAAHHPLWPVAALAVFWVWCVLAAWRPTVWLWLVPAALPVFNFSPWTGWIVFDEFDLLLLGALAGGYARRALGAVIARPQAVAIHGREPQLHGLPRSARNDDAKDLDCHAPSGLAMTMTLLLVACLGLLGLWRGFNDAGGFAFDWFAGYADALNSWRVFKGLGYTLLFVPLMQQALARDAGSAGRHLALGMVAGLSAVTAATLWERAAFPGLLDFSSHYRTVALFWEMHVGGAALDAYLVISVPFAAWALVTVRRPLAWTACALLALLAAYACLASFSRGVYLAVALPLALLALLLRLQRCERRGEAFWGSDWHRVQYEGWRARAGALLLLALVGEAALVLGSGSFMTHRLDDSGRDWGSRLEHWQHGLDLLEGPEDWLLGKGLGRLPSHYAGQVPHGEFPGDAQWREVAVGAAARAYITVHGPASRPELVGQFVLTQRVASGMAGGHRVRLDLRVEQPSQIRVSLCERHLLYDRRCQTAFVRVVPHEGEPWQSLELTLRGPSLTGGPSYAPRLAVFSLSVLNVAGAADFAQVQLQGARGQPLLANADFSRGLAQWLPSARSFFLPWHIDNLYLELLLERGLTGLLLFVALVACALWRLVFGCARQAALAPYLAASLSGGLLLGLVSSFMDVPRVAFLYFLLTLVALCQAPRVQRTSSGLTLDSTYRASS